MEEKQPLRVEDEIRPVISQSVIIDIENENDEPDLWLEKWKEFLKADLIPTGSTNDRLWLTDIWRPFRQYFKMNFQPSTMIPAAITRDKEHLEKALEIIKELFPGVLYYEFSLAGLKWKKGPRLSELNVIGDMKEGDFRLLVMRHIQKAHTLIKTNQTDQKERLNQIERILERKTSMTKFPGVVYMMLLLVSYIMLIILFSLVGSKT